MAIGRFVPGLHLGPGRSLSGSESDCPCRFRHNPFGPFCQGNTDRERFKAYRNGTTDKDYVFFFGPLQLER